MILVKRKYLYILALLICVLLIFGELRFFYALQNINLQQNLMFKYELESFIFVSIVMLLIVSVFVFYFMRSSTRVLRVLDKIVELSSYGKHDVSMHLEKLGPFGVRIKYLIHNLRDMNSKQSLKMSSLSGIIEGLIAKNSLPMFLINRHGNILNCSNKFLACFDADKKMIEKKNINELSKNLNYEKVFFKLEGKSEHIEREGVDISLNEKIEHFKIIFTPITNAENNISHIICVAVK